MNKSKEVCKYILPRGINQGKQCDKFATIDGYCSGCYSKPGKNKLAYVSTLKLPDPSDLECISSLKINEVSENRTDDLPHNFPSMELPHEFSGPLSTKEELESAHLEFINNKSTSEEEEDEKDALYSPINTDDGSELICVQNEATESCEENDGIPRCLVLIRRKRWEKIESIVESLTNTDVEHDHSSGGHGCIIQYNIQGMIEECQIFDSLSPDVIEFIRKIEDDTFISQIREDIINAL